MDRKQNTLRTYNIFERLYTEITVITDLFVTGYIEKPRKSNGVDVSNATGPTIITLYVILLVIILL